MEHLFSNHGLMASGGLSITAATVGDLVSPVDVTTVGNGWGTLDDATVTAGADHLQVAALPWRWTFGGFEILLVTTRRAGRWILPKGWPEKTERLFQAAAREANEEAGVTGVVSTQEAGCYYYEKQTASGVELPCLVKVFPVEVRSLAGNWAERKQRRRAWLPPNAAALVAKPDLRELIASFDPALLESERKASGWLPALS